MELIKVESEITESDITKESDITEINITDNVLWATGQFNIIPTEQAELLNKQSISQSPCEQNSDRTFSQLKKSQFVPIPCGQNTQRADGQLKKNPIK